MKSQISVLLIALTAILAACDGAPSPSSSPTQISRTNSELEATVAALQTEIALRGTMGILQTQVAETDSAQPTTVAKATPLNPPTSAPSGPTTPPQPAGTFYVATDGSDSNGDGSADKPWATIQQALRSVSDGSTILVRPGVYTGRLRLLSYRTDVTFTQGVTLRSEQPYAAQLRAADSTVVTCYENCHGITMEGFDIAHLDPGTPDRVIVFHIDGQGTQHARNITLRNNIIHDSYNNDILKINNNASKIVVEGNIFYNQQGSDEHIDINSVEDVTIQDNIFFNDFEGSGRRNTNDSGNYVVVKDSNGDEDGVVGSDKVIIRRNIFANWQGGEGSYFVLIGEDGMPFHEARNVTVENNLILGNSRNVMRAPFGVKGGRDITFRNNTVVGDLPARAFAMRLNIESENPPNENINFFNNIWSDPTGTMGSSGQDTVFRFAEVPPDETASFTLSNNLYWNGSKTIPTSAEDILNIGSDSKQKTGDPRLGTQDNLKMPRWDPQAGRFADQSRTIREAFEKMVENYAKPAQGSPAIDAADPSNTPPDDILGNRRPENSAPDIGAVELKP